ncbi:shiftless antiviral inhibitor of ribosomal frameshifting protein homolog [Ptychodera flava]|uniref:shiftless antiviral inhibitor of ribosomal frameshifting protein homolog n=1 Tax=Ptychodera flava TaxID=63121 RepID=UPI00396A8BE3
MASIQKPFYIAKEEFKFQNDTEEKSKGKVHATGSAIKKETKTDIEFQVLRNGTMKFLVTGVKENVGVAIALLQRRLTNQRRQVTEKLPDGISALTVDNLRKHNQALTEKREFGCEPCDNVYWRKVFQYKPVARCDKCGVRYDAIPKDQEYGLGTYECTSCNRKFSGRARADVPAMCYDCHVMVRPTNIGPRPRGQRRSRNIHSCQACHNGAIRPCPMYKRVVVPSKVHQSTGSTVSSFLSQQSAIYYPPLQSGSPPPPPSSSASSGAEPTTATAEASPPVEAEPEVEVAN